MRWRSMVAGLAAVLAWAPEASATPPDCGELVIDDALNGATVGSQQGGSFGGSGFVPGAGGGSITWDFDSAILQGCVEVTVTGVTTAGIGEHDLFELFTGPDGSFSDGNEDHFLLYKVAGDVYPDYEGRLKVEMGLEYSTVEVGTWSGNLSWDAATSYTLAVKLDDMGVASFYRDDELLAEVDYNSIEAGQLPFESLRVPNNGDYQAEAGLADVIYSDVRVYDATPAPPGGSTGDDGAVDSSGDDAAATEDDAGDDDPLPTTGADDGGSDGGGDAGDDGSGGGTTTGPAGIPLTGGRSDSDSGCGCRSGRGGPGAWALLVLVAFARRRRR